MRRIAMSNRLAPSAIVLIVVALLVGRAGLAMPFAREAHAGIAMAPTPSHAGRRVDAVHEAPSAPTETRRTAVPRASATAIPRAHVPLAGGTDGPRGTVAAHVSGWSPGVLARRAPGVAVEGRVRGVVSPGQPAPASRAPPLG